MIRIRKLRVVGRVKDYDASFLDDQGEVRPLSIIAGEISTGKSSILDFIDYCLGAADHPRQIEVVRQGRAAQLEVEIQGAICTIERPLFTSEHWALIHECAIDGLGVAHPSRRVVLGPASETRSLNWTLLRASGLEGTLLKQAPTRQTSATDFLSFRDVLDLAYLDASRLAPGHLLHEAVFMKRLKLQQLIEIVFGVHDQTAAAMGDRIKTLEDERALQKREIEALNLFLLEQETPDRATLVEERATVQQRQRDSAARLRALDADIAAETSSAAAVRESYSTAQRRVRHAASKLRDRDSLLQRLLPLRGQYVEDERKLVFFAEARVLFDPLAVKTCPSCLNELVEPPSVENGRCTLCDHSVGAAGEREIDVDVERRMIGARLRALDRYIAEVGGERAEAHRAFDRAVADESKARSELDSDLGARLAPFVADRDRLVRAVEGCKARRSEIDRLVAHRDSVARRAGELSDLEARLSELRAEHERLQTQRPEKELVLAELSGRFAGLLDAFRFPKLNDPEPPSLSSKFHPFVRGVPYEQLRSRGATTLVAVAWQLTMFELAVELSRPHPGFLMIDSPQSGLKPAEGETPAEQFDQAEIAERLWLHVRNWAREHPEVQLIVVDNLPPALVEDDVVVRYSGRADRPPYGFIDNEDAAAR
jgi:hypothetical protein